jgi:hypothetical protein
MLPKTARRKITRLPDLVSLDPSARALLGGCPSLDDLIRPHQKRR